MSAIDLPCLIATALLCSAFLMTAPARAQDGFAAVRGDRASGWLAQGRSEVLARTGMVTTSQPLAAQAGLRILEKGGNAFDAAVATAAVLNVVEPGSAGIGGDVFVIAWMAKEHKLIALNGSYRAHARWCVAGRIGLSEGWRGGRLVTSRGLCASAHRKNTDW